MTKEELYRHKQRPRVLTDADLEALQEVFQEQHISGALGLTPDEISVLKKFLKGWDKTTSLIGTIILTAIVVGIIAIFTKGFWTSLVQGILKAGKP